MAKKSIESLFVKSNEDKNKVLRLKSMYPDRYPKGILGVAKLASDFDLMKDSISGAPLHNAKSSMEKRKSASIAKRKKIKTSQQKKRERLAASSKRPSTKANSKRFE